jgi:hypothetical protein
MRDVSNFLRNWHIELIDFRPHKQLASTRRALLSREQVNLIQNIYSLDFEHYGYEFDPLSNVVPPSIIQDQDICDDIVQNRFNKPIDLTLFSEKK